MSQWHSDGSSLAGQAWDHPITLRLNCTATFVPGIPGILATAIHTWQALKMHKETQCPLETHPSSCHYFLKFYYNNHFEEWAWWLQLRFLLCPLWAQGDQEFLENLWGPAGQREETEQRQLPRALRSRQGDLHTTSMLAVINAGFHSTLSPLGPISPEVLAVLGHSCNLK